MTNSFNYNLSGTESVSLDIIDQEKFVDIHCHCLASVDDGPSTNAESLSLCCGLVNDGVSEVIATPHQLGRFSDCNESDKIREAVRILNEDLKNNGIALTVVPGGDIRVDERICRLLESDKILTLADGGRYILLELPGEIFIDIEPLILELSSLGIEVIISHPERHFVFAKQPKILLKWISRYAHLQITSGSLLGQFGPIPQKVAWHFLSSGWASLVATDAHDLDSRRPCMRKAFSHISVKLGRALARLVCIENPMRVLKGQDIREVYSIGAGKYFDETIPRSS